MDHYGLLSLLPTAFVITTAVLTHRPVAALLVGVVIGILLLDPTAAVSTFSDILLEVMQDETIGWVIMVCGLMGSLIYILIKTGGASAFARKCGTHYVNGVRYGARFYLLITYKATSHRANTHMEASLGIDGSSVGSGDVKARLERTAQMAGVNVTIKAASNGFWLASPSERVFPK